MRATGSPPSAPSRALAELLIGRPLRQAEEAIDVALLNDALSDAKDELDAAIQAEMLHATVMWANGGTLDLNVTTAMLAPLEQLHELGRQEAWNELERLGYNIPRRAFAVDPFPSSRDPGDYLRSNLTGIEVRIRDGLVRADLASASTDAVARALLRIPGGRDIASRIVSTALINGLAQTFEQVADDIGCWEYSAVLDGGTCTRCSPLDGTRYDTLDELFLVLPNFGPNPRCLGGGRCRCRAVPCPPGESTLARRQEPGPLGDAFQRPGGTAPTAVAVRDSIDLADRVHTAVVAQKAKVVADPAMQPNNPGSYHLPTSTIRISTTADTPHTTFLHEVGHFLSHQAFGVPGQMSAADAPELLPWRRAIVDSAAVRQLDRLRLFGGHFELTLRDGRTVQVPVDPDRVEYLIDAEELFARSYAQYVVVRSGDATLRRELEIDIGNGNLYPEQWSEDDFAPIADAFDLIFEDLGWLR